MRHLAAYAFVTLVAVLVFGLFVGSRVVVSNVTVRLGMVMPFRFAVMSDIHIGADRRSVDKTRKAIMKAMAQRPDAVLLLGDFVVNRQSIPYVKPALKGLKAPLGVYAVLGNHDHWAGSTQIALLLQSLGIRVLVNESAILRKGKAAVALVGIDDLWTGKPDWRKAFSGLPKGVPIVLLSHNPDAAIFWLSPDEQQKLLTKHAAISREDISQLGSFLRHQPVKLILSGHTHGGHVWLPLNRLFAYLTSRRGIPATEYGWRYPCGLRDIGTTWVYTTKGVTAGNSMPRWFNAPEIAIVELR